jgi:hypothetical protein
MIYYPINFLYHNKKNKLIQINMGCICSIEEEKVIKRKKSNIIINTPIFSNDFILHDYINFSDNNIDKIF